MGTYLGLMRAPLTGLCAMAICLALGCDKPEPLVNDVPPMKPVESAAAPEAAPKVEVGPALDGKPPLLGSDPYGLLSRKPGTQGSARRDPVDPSKLDPSALMASDRSAMSPPSASAARDPRAVARSQIETTERLPTEGSFAQRVVAVRADDVASRVLRGSGRPHVLLLYGAFCGVCRGVLPEFVDATRAYHRRNVGFTLASIDADQERFSAYVPTLRRFFEPLLIIRDEDHSTPRALRRLGLTMDDEGLAVPLAAVFDKKGKVVAEGRGDVMKRVAKILDGLI